MDELINEITDLIDSGEKVYLHRQTREILSHPDLERLEYVDSETEYIVDEVLGVVDADYDNYIMISPPDSSVSYRMMESFVFTVPDETKQRRFLDALNGKKPFRRFREVVSDYDLDDDWYDYKTAQLAEWVKEELLKAENGEEG